MKVLSIMMLNPATIKPPTPEEYARMDELINEMRSKGVLIETGGAVPGSFAARVSRKDGRDTVTDGPFAEAKEVIGGYALVEVANGEEAIAWTHRLLDLVGDAACELREVISG